MLVEVGLAALSNVVADAVATAAHGAQRRLRADPERRALASVVVQAATDAFSVARRGAVKATDQWINAVAEQWAPAFTPDVVSQLMAAIAAPSTENRQSFAQLIRSALQDGGCDLKTLEQTVSVEEFTHIFPEQFWRGLKQAAIPQPELRGLVEFLFAQRNEHRNSRPTPATPRDYRHDLALYLQRLLDEARNSLPRFLPPGRATNLDQRARVRIKSRVSDSTPEPTGDPADRTYRPPVEFAGRRIADPGSEQSWDEARESSPRIVVLSDPGLGKSWLVRNETIRLALAALADLDEDRIAAIPVPIRADWLAGAGQRSIGTVAAELFVGKGWLGERAVREFAEQVDAGHAHLLVDGLDEVPREDGRQYVRAALADWSDRPGSRQWILTSRNASYSGPVPRGTVAIELQSLTDGQVVDYVRGWGLPASAENRLLNTLTDPAASGMARIPLLLAMLCSLAGELPDGEEIPRTRAALYERMLLHFLERPHRETSGRDNEATLRRVLAGIAFQFAHRDGGWADPMLRDELVEAVQAQSASADLTFTAEQLIEHLSADLGLLVPEGDTSGGRRARYLFVHRTFAEYLVAHHLTTCDDDLRWAIIERHLWFDAEWLQVISMVGGLLKSDETRRLVAHLRDVDGDAFGQAWLMAIRVISEHPRPDDLLEPEDGRSLREVLGSMLRHPELRRFVVSTLREAPVLAPTITRALFALAGAEEVEVRIAVLCVLARVYAPDPTALLLEGMGDPDERVAAEAAHALTGRASPAVAEALMSRMLAGPDRVSQACTDALVGLRTDLRVEAAAPSLRADNPRDVRVAAYPVLRGAGPAALPLILAGLEDPDPDVFVAAAAVLGDEPLDPRAEAALLRRLIDLDDDSAGADDPIVWNGNVGVRRDRDARAARAALGRGRSQDPAFTTAYLRQVVDQDDGLSLLDGSTDPTAPTAALVSELLQRLRSTARVPRLRAARVLRVLQPKGIDEALGDLLRAEEPDTLVAALEAARGRRNDVLFGAVKPLTTHADDVVRVEALETVIEGEPADLDEVLLAGLNDASARVRRLAAGACAGRGDWTVVDALVKRIQQREEPASVVVAAIGALRNREDPGVRDALLACLQRETGGPEPDLYIGPAIHVAAAHALAAHEATAVLDAIRVHATSPDGYVGREAVGALTRCPARGAVELLLEVLESGPRKSQVAAWWALSARPFPGDLLTIVDRLHCAPPKARPGLIAIARKLADQHYRALSATERIHVREKLCAALATAAGRSA